MVMTLQRRALPILTASMHSRLFLSRSCAFAGFRQMATDSGANTVSANSATHLSSLNALAKSL
jgi:hypothetical protein